MKIAYIVNIRMPNEKAHGFYVMKTAYEFARSGEQVTLYVPTRKNHLSDDAFKYYSLSPIFPIKKVHTWDAFVLQKYIGRASFPIQSLCFFISLMFVNFEAGTVVYTTTPEVAWLMSVRGYKTIYNAHNWPESKVSIFEYFLRHVRGVVANSNGTLEEFKKHGFTNAIAAPNGVDLAEYSLKQSKSELRQELGLPTDKRIALYVGHLYGWKGVDTVIAAAQKITADNKYIFVIVGGTEKDIERYQRMIDEQKISNVLLLGHKEKSVIPRYLKAADVLLLPNIPNTKESELYTSPMKMFEYMASGVPIIASDLPSIREVLNEKNATLVKAGDPEALVNALDALAKNVSNSADSRAAQAKKDVEAHTWDKHAQKVLEFLKTNSA